MIVVRDGSAILFSEFGKQPVKLGDVILLGANTLCGSEPEGHITVTAIDADTDYVIDQVFWQNVGVLHDRLDAQDFAATIYTEPAQVLRLGEDRAGMLMPWLDVAGQKVVDGIAPTADPSDPLPWRWRLRRTLAEGGPLLRGVLLHRALGRR